MNLKNESPSDKMKKNIRNVFWLYVMLFLAVIVYLSYFMLISAKNIVGDPHNPRLSVLDNEVKRGTIYDSEWNVLAESALQGDVYVRNYANGKNLSHLIGYVDKGKSGIEASNNFDLQKLHNEVWQRIKQLSSGSELVANSIQLTIDSNIQQEAFEQLGNNKGGIIVMEPDTGKILAMSSYPNFDPNTIAENWEELDSADNSPFLNRTTQGLYAPGSVFKILTAAALIENKEDYKDIVYNCEGEASFQDKIIHCINSKVHGEVDIAEAFAYSCNTFFAVEGYEMGATALIDSATTRYFNKPIGYPLEYNVNSFALSPDATESQIVETAIGQGKTQASPLLIAMITSAVANDGVMMRPYVVDKIISYNDREVSKSLPKMLDTVFSVDVSNSLRDIMRGVVERGTATAANIDGAYVIGKTGTAENPAGTSHSWFTVYGEKNGKKVVVTVVLENPENGVSAVPIGSNVLNKALR